MYRRPRCALHLALSLVALAASPGVALADPPAPATAYTGHGVESVAPALLEKFRPQPLPAGASRRIQAMLDVRAPSAGVVSPDGKALYFNWNVTGVNQVWTIAAPEDPRRFPVQLTGGEDPTVLAGITPDGRHLLVQRDRKGEENPGLYLQDSHGGPLVEIQHKAGVQTQLQYISDDSRWIWYRANDAKKDAYAIYRYDVEKKQREAVFTEDGLWSLEEAAPDGRLLLERSTGSLSSEWWEWDPARRTKTPLVGQGEKEEYNVAWGARPGELVVLTNKPGDLRRLYRLSGGRLTALGEEAPWDVARFTIDRRKTRILYQLNEGGYFRLRALDARTYKPLALPRLPEADNVYAGSTTPDGRFTTLGVDDGLHPLQSFVLDWRSRKTRVWHIPSTPEIDTTAFVRATLEKCPVRDGASIPVLVRRPARCASERCPVVVHFHGGPEGQSRPGFNTFAQLFVDAGFVFVEPNVRGSDGYGKAWLRADDGPRRLQVITDIEDAARWARERFTVAGQAPRVGILGGSYGGYSVLMGMTMFAGAYDAGVDIVGISNLATFLKNTAPYRRILRISEYGDPEKDAEALGKLSPITWVDRVKAPLLIFQGATDPRVPAGEAIQIHDALAGRGVPTRLMIFPDEGHGAQKRENRVIMYGQAVAFFEQHLR